MYNFLQYNKYGSLIIALLIFIYAPVCYSENNQPLDNSHQPSDKPHQALVKILQLVNKSPQLETRSPQLETRSPQLETRSPQLEIRSPQPEIRSPQLETRSPQPEIRSPQLETKSPQLENHHQQPGEITKQKEKTSVNRSLPFLSARTPAVMEKKEPAAPMDALSVSLGLIFILLLIFLLAWIMRKAGYSQLSGKGYLSILATLNLGQKEKIALLKVGRQQILIGITANQINTLHVLDEPLDIKELQADAGKNQFAAKLSEVLNVSSARGKNKNE